MQLNENTDVQEILSECYLSTAKTAKVLFPERFHLPFSRMHEQLFEVLDDESIQKLCIAAPRGFGKTSLINLALPARYMLFRDKKFIVPVSSSNTSAVLQAENLKRELLQNQNVVKLFGSLKSDSFSKDQWITEGGTMVMPRGSGQQVRGLLHGNSRPDCIIIDDLEDAEKVRSEEQRQKLKEWFFADVTNSVNRSRDDWRIIMIGTVLHEDALLQNLLESESGWTKIKLSICNEIYESNWPDFLSDKKVKALADDYREQGLLDVFYREYMNIPISVEDAVFKPEYFKYFDDVELVEQDHRIENVILVDPAKTVKLHSAFSAIVCVGVDCDTNALYVKDLVNKRLHPDELYDEIFKMAEIHNVSVIGLEVTSLNEFITYPMKNEMVRRNRMFELIELKARAKKEDRIAALAGFYRQGLIYHKKGVCDVLEDQLMSFPRSRYFDAMDAFAYIVEMLELGYRYFEPTDETYDDPEEIEKEYAKLSKHDPPPLEDWRTV